MPSVIKHSDLELMIIMKEIYGRSMPGCQSTEELCVVKVVSKVQDKKVSQKAVDLMEGNSLHYTVALWV